MILLLLACLAGTGRASSLQAINKRHTTVELLKLEHCTESKDWSASRWNQFVEVKCPLNRLVVLLLALNPRAAFNPSAGTRHCPCRVRTSPGSCALSHSSPNSPKVILDLGYGFPTQKGPWRERVQSVAKQLVNALPSLRAAGLVVVVVGEAKSIEPVKDRISELVAGESAVDCLTFMEGDLCDVTLDGIYLSPDAHETLDVSVWPPQTLIVGGIVDRRTVEGRSMRRAGKVGFEARQLPLERVGLPMLQNAEPLNIDTILELLAMWAKRCVEDGSADSEMTFAHAAADAMLRHKNRHPRTPLKLPLKESLA